MNPCHEYMDAMLRYLANELSDNKLEDLLAHLRTCVACSTWLEEQRTLSEILRRSRPLYSAPPNLRARINHTFSQLSSSQSGRRRSARQFWETIRKCLPDFSRFAPRLAVLAPALAVLIACVALVPNVVRQVHAASYVETAVSNHRNYVAGDLPLGIHSSSPAEVTAWLADRVPFPFRLPNSQLDREGTPAYRLIGATLVPYKERLTALVIYQGILTKDTISLLVASSNSAVVAGGDEVRSGDLTFHYRHSSNFKVITWSTHGLSYALVSNVSASAQASCMVCHQNMADHGAFRTGR